MNDDLMTNYESYGFNILLASTNTLPMFGQRSSRNQIDIANTQIWYIMFVNSIAFVFIFWAIRIFLSNLFLFHHGMDLSSHHFVIIFNDNSSNINAVFFIAFESHSVILLKFHIRIKDRRETTMGTNQLTKSSKSIVRHFSFERDVLNWYSLTQRLRWFLVNLKLN